MGEVLDKFAAGELLRKRRDGLGLTQEQVVEGTSLTVAAYLSELENGKVSVGRSKHFPSLAAFLKLTEDDIRAINPSAIFNMDAPTPAPHPASAAAQGYNIPNTVPEIPETLLEAARLYGDTSAFAGLRDLRWQRFLADLPYKNGPRTPEAWLEAFVEAQGKYDPR